MKDHVRQGCVRRPVAYRLALWPGALVAVFTTPAVCQDQPLWELGVGFSAISFADYNGVDPQYATVERSAFSADGGFGGWRWGSHATRAIYGMAVSYAISTFQRLPSPTVRW